jgi:hypothetical protein
MRNYLIIGFFLLTGCMNKKVEFKRVERTNDQYVISGQKMDTAFVNNLEQVLNYYEVGYERIDGTSILVEEKLFEDKDLMYNYTNKAMDAEWLETHKK